METAVELTEPDRDVTEESTPMETETTDAERMLREFHDSQRETSYETAQKMNQCVCIPQPQEEQIELPVQIKHEPELILEPEELPAFAITDAEAVMDSAETSTGEFSKMPNIVLDPNKCFICNKVFESTEDARIHLSEHGDMIPYECSACTIETGQKLRITSLHRLHSHFRLHVSAMKCPECPHRTGTRCALLKHIRKYHEQSDHVEYICEQCRKKYVNKNSFIKHVLYHKALDEGRYPCSYCDKKLSSATGLVGHERVHTGERPYQCYACDKRFHMGYSLSEHIFKVHKKSEHVFDNTIRTCKFEGCDFSTVNRRKFNGHKAKHELRFQCSECSQRFARGQHLRQHQHVHTGVKPFQCEQCVKSFLNKRDLLKHVAKHNIDHPSSV